MPASEVVGRSVIIIGADSRPFDEEATRATQQTGDRAGKSFTKSFGGILMVGAKAAGAGIAGVLGASFVKGFTRLTAIDDATGKLKGLGYNAKEVQKIMDNALASVKGTSFGLGDAASQAANLVASGIKPGQELTRTLKLLGDTASIAGVGMDEIGGTFQDVAVAGHLTSDALDSLQSSGIPVLSFLAKASGESMGKVAEDVSKGKVSFNEFQTAMEQGLGGAAKAAGGTFTGAMSNVSAALGRFGAAMLGGVFAKLPELFAQLITWLDKITPAAKEAGAAIGVWFGQAFDLILAIVRDPMVTGFFSGLASVVMNQVVPALQALFNFGGQVVGYFQEHSTQAKILVGVMGALYAITMLHTAVLAAQASAGLIAYLKGLNVVANATKVWTALQWLLNIALNANPISLIIIALVALGAALVVAYMKSETFRDIVNGVWAAIKTAVQTVVGWITGTAVPFVVGAWTSISTGVTNLRNAITGAWETIMTALRAVVSWIVATFGPTFRTLQAVVTAVFQAIQILILAWWRLGVLPVFNLVVDGLTALGRAFTSFWKDKIVPVFDGVTAVISAAWNKGILPVFNLIKDGIESLSKTFTSWWRNNVEPVMGGIGRVISATWTGVIKPAFDALSSGVGRLKGAFDTAVSGIGTAWDRLKGITQAPIRFVIQTVLNDGLIRAFNWLGSKVGGPTIANIPLPFASGGVLPGYTPGRDVHRFYSATGGSLALSGGEAIMRPEFTRKVGGRAGVHRLNMMARMGQLPAGFANGGVTRKFAVGGIVDFIKSAGSSAFDWVGDKASEAFQGFTNPLAYLKSKMPTVPGAGLISSYANAGAGKLLTAAVEKLTGMWKEFQKLFGGDGNGKVMGWQNQMEALHTRFPGLQLISGYRPGAITATGNQSYHAQGRAVDIPPRSDVFEWIRGKYLKNIKELIFSPANGRQIWNGANHVYGEPTRSMHFDHVHWAMKNGGIFDAGNFDTGGVLRPGLNLVRNGTGADERLVPTGSGNTYIDVTISVDDLEKMKDVGDFLDMLKNSRATSRKTRRSGRVAS